MMDVRVVAAFAECIAVTAGSPGWQASKHSPPAVTSFLGGCSWGRASRDPRLGVRNLCLTSLLAEIAVSLSDVDRRLLDQCLKRSPRAWENFVDRFLGLVVHVANHSAHLRQIRLTPEQRDDLVAEVFVALVDQEFAALRRFRRNSSLATYLAVIARRIIVRRMMSGDFKTVPIEAAEGAAEPAVHETRIADQEQVEQMIARLDPHEARVVRMFHLEGKSYGEISAVAGMSENSVGPVLSRARAKLRENGPAN